MKRLTLLWATAAMALVSCEKEKQLPERTTEFVFVHASSGTGNALITLSGEDVISSGLSYGQSTASTGLPYISTGAGIRQVKVNAQGSPVTTDFNTYLPEQNKLSFWLYDTLLANASRSPALLMLTDQLNPVSDSVHFRFLHLATGKNNIRARLVSETPIDTLNISNLLNLPLTNPDYTSLSAFNRFLKTGSYKVELLDETGAVVQVYPNFSVEKSRYTTIYTSGAYNSSSPTPFSLNFIQHR